MKDIDLPEWVGFVAALFAMALYPLFLLFFEWATLDEINWWSIGSLLFLALPAGTAIIINRKSGP